MFLLKHDLKMKMLCKEKHMHSVIQAEIRNLRETNDPDDNTDSKITFHNSRLLGVGPNALRLLRHYGLTVWKNILRMRTSR